MGQATIGDCESREASERRDQHERQRREEERQKVRPGGQHAARRARLLEQFQLVSLLEPQNRGYLLEPFLSELFELEGALHQS